MKVFCNKSHKFVEIKDNECERKELCIHSEFTYCPTKIIVDIEQRNGEKDA